MMNFVFALSKERCDGIRDLATTTMCKLHHKNVLANRLSYLLFKIARLYERDLNSVEMPPIKACDQTKWEI